MPQEAQFTDSVILSHFMLDDLDYLRIALLPFLKDAYLKMVYSSQQNLLTVFLRKNTKCEPHIYQNLLQNIPLLTRQAKLQAAILKKNQSLREQTVLQALFKVTPDFSYVPFENLQELKTISGRTS